MKEILKKNNLKVTANRVEILELINKLDIDATIKKILDNTTIDQSTVYRTIETFLEKKIIETSINHKNELYYTINEQHKHYIKCIKCHKKEVINICPIENLEKNGYKIINHKIEIEGICNKCQTN